MPQAPWVSVSLLTALLVVASVSLAEPFSEAFRGSLAPPLPLSLPDDAGQRIMQLRLYAADQCTSPVPRVTDAQLVVWAVARWELQYLEQWVRGHCVGCPG